MARIRIDPITLTPESGPTTIRAEQIDAITSTGAIWLYRFLDDGGELLYVGISGNLRERMRRHRQRAAWWPTVKHIRLAPFPKEHLALAAERAAIRAEGPLHNIRSVVR